MSVKRKLTARLYSGRLSEVTRLKDMWRNEFSEEQREFWRARFYSATSSTKVRAELKEKLGVELTYDKQLQRVREFDEDQLLRDKEAEATAADERHFREQFPDISEEELRQKVMAAYQARALSRGDVDLGKFTLRHDLAERRFQFEQEQAAKANRREEEQALDLCMKEAEKNPEAQKLFDEAFAALRQAEGT